MVNLPSGYTELEYIESTGTQYIDSSYIPNNNTKTIAEFQLTNVSTTNCCIFGVVGQYSFRWYDTHFRSNGNNSVDFSTNLSWENKYVVTKIPEQCILDSETVTNIPGTVTKSLFIFAQQNNSNSPQNFSSMKLYALSIYENDNLILNYVPCKNNLGQIGLYETVNGNFNNNNGTEDFIAGPEIIKPNMYVKINNIWQPVIGIYTKTNNTW